MNILGISGSSASASINALLLDSALALIDDATVQVVSVRDLDAPMYSVDVESSEGAPAAIRRLYDHLQAADAVVLASPEHNGMPPAMLKNCIDWLSRVQPGIKWILKPVVLLSASPGPGGGARNLAHLAGVIPHWGATVVGTCSVGRWHKAYDAEAGTLTDPTAREALAQAMGGLTKASK
jgi:chromate reductase, NAD(P)H dehydrogenase (quinone)